MVSTVLLFLFFFCFVFLGLFVLVFSNHAFHLFFFCYAYVACCCLLYFVFIVDFVIEFVTDKNILILLLIWLSN